LAKKVIGATLVLKDGSFASNIGKAISSTKNFRNSISKTLDSMSKMHKKSTDLSGGIKKLAGVLGAAVAVRGAFNLGKEALKQSADMEQTFIAYTTMLGSKEKAYKMINDLTKLAIKTPFEMPDLADSTRQYLAFGGAEDKVIDKLTLYGDVASGLGKGADGINTIVEALGKLKSAERVDAQYMDSLTSMGIPAWNYLAKTINKTTGETRKLAEKNLIPIEKAIKGIEDGMRADPKFLNGMLNQSKSLYGLWSTMKDFFNLSIMKSFGDGIRVSILPELTGLVDELTNGGDATQTLTDKMKGFGTSVGSKISGVFLSVKGYIKRLMGDETFRNLSLGDKIVYVMKDMVNSARIYMDGDGGVKLKEIFRTTTTILVDVLEGALTEVMPVAIALGVGIGGGILTGIGEGLKKPITDAGAKISKNGSEFFDNGYSGFAPLKIFSKMFDNQIEKEVNGRKLNFDGSHYFGLPNVPRDGYVARLHKDEGVLTAKENKEYRSGGKSVQFGDIKIYVSGPTSDDVINEFVPKLKFALANM